MMKIAIYDCCLNRIAMIRLPFSCKFSLRTSILFSPKLSYFQRSYYVNESLSRTFLSLNCGYWTSDRLFSTSSPNSIGVNLTGAAQTSLMDSYANILSINDEMSIKTIQKILFECCSGRFEWNTLPNEVQVKLQSVVDLACKNYFIDHANSKKWFSTFIILSKTFLNWNDIPLSLRLVIEQFIVDNTDISCYCFVLLDSFVFMKCTWNSFSVPVQQKLITIGQSYTFPDNNNKLLDWLIMLDKLNAPRDCYILSHYEQAILRGSTKTSTMVDKQSVYPLIKSLVSANIAWMELNSDVQTAIVEYVLQNLNSLMKKGNLDALCTLLFDAPHTALLQSLYIGILTELQKSIQGKQIRQFTQTQLAYFEFIKTQPQGIKLLTQYLPDVDLLKCKVMPLSNNDRRDKFSLSLLQTELEYCVQNCDMGVLKSDFCGLQTPVFPVDFAIIRNEQSLAFIVIDEESDYTADGQLRRSEQFKDYLYTYNHSHTLLYRMKQSEVMALGEQEAAELLIQTIINDLQ